MAPTAKNSGSVEEIPIGLVMRGDHLEIRSGELIPADGNIISGSGSVNKAPLTGESVPVDVVEGDELQAGLTLSRGPVTIEVTAVGEDTRLSGLIETGHIYKDKPTRLQGALQNFTSIWVPLVLIGAVLVCVFLLSCLNRALRDWLLPRIHGEVQGVPVRAIRGAVPAARLVRVPVVVDAETVDNFTRLAFSEVLRRERERDF